MSWTVTASKAQRPDGAPLIQLTYTDGLRTVVEAYEIGGLVSDAFLADRAHTRIVALTAEDALAATLTVGVVVPQASDPVLSPSSQYQQDFLAWTKMKKLVDLGIMSAADPAFVEADKTAKTNFDVAYLPLLSFGVFS